MVEHAAHNRLVVGSNPSEGTILYDGPPGLSIHGHNRRAIHTQNRRGRLFYIRKKTYKSLQDLFHGS